LILSLVFGGGLRSNPGAKAQFSFSRLRHG
jgi:hypothetical protein